MALPKLALTGPEVGGLAADVIVLGMTERADGVELVAPTSPPVAEVIDAFRDTPGGLLAVLRSLGATGKADEVVAVPTFGRLAAEVLLAVGFGRTDVNDEVSAEQVRRASGAAARALAGKKRAVTLLSVLSLQDLGAAAEGTILGAYNFTDYRSDSVDAPVAKVDLVGSVGETDKRRRTRLKAAVAIAEAVCTARDFVNTPPNDLYPGAFADRARQLCSAVGLEVEVLDEKALRKDGYGGVLGVGGGSSRPPRLLRLRYKGPKPQAKIALVGKGVTFDTGGISIKPATNMEQMTSDMSGAAAVIASTVLAAKLRYPLEVTATVPMVENMPSGTAYRPGDVLRLYSGKTVEVLNTDAEGRLILADAISRAGEDDPDYLIEISTLTGAQVIALGNRTAGVMGSEAFRDRVVETAQTVGESAWAMPLPDELRAELDSRLADIANVTGHRWGGMLVAGVFLGEFVADGLQWAHIDMAGPAFNSVSPWGYTPKGGTGAGVRTIAAVLADIAENG